MHLQVGDPFWSATCAADIPVGDAIIKAYPLVASNVCHWVLYIEAHWVV